MTDALVRAVSLTRTVGDVRAVDGIDLEVGKGELFGFLGPNGAGKTTTMRLLTGLLRPTSGDAFVAGHSLTTEPGKARAALGFVPDTPYLYEKLTAREFLAFSAALHGVDAALAERRAGALLALLELEGAADGLVEGYSHGMRQKTALAGALLHNPQAFFLDEPTVGLDPRSARLIKDILREVSERGTAVFMSTHILEIAERMCDRVAIISGGQVIATGTLDELRAGRSGESLEDIFLALTGGAEEAELADALA